LLIWVCLVERSAGGSYIRAPRKGVRLFPPTCPQEFVNINLIRNITRNLKQRAIFKLRSEQEESYFKEHPTDRANAAAQRMRAALFSALQRARALP